MTKKRIAAYFSGRVQGVGFRFTAERIALDFALTGFVRNLPDGRVEVVAEGREAALREFLVKIKKEMCYYIKSVELREGECSGEFSDFGIRF